MNNKPKLIPRFPLMTAWGCMFGLVMLVLGLATGGLISIYVLPSLWNYDGTQTVVWRDIYQMGTAQAAFNQALNETLQAEVAHETQVALMFQGTAMAMDSAALATQAALGNSQALLNQTATQSQQFIFATQTMQAALNAQERTRVAMDYAATQVALQQNATQVQLDFQRTQAALPGTAINQALPGESGNAVAMVATMPAFDSQSADVVIATSIPPTTTPVPTRVEIMAQAQVAAVTETPMPTATLSTPVLLPPTNTQAASLLATATPAPVDETFISGIDTAVWNVSDAGDWRIDSKGITAQRSGAWLMTRGSYSGNYAVTVSFIPALIDRADYAVLLNVDSETGLVLMLKSQALSVTEVSLEQQNGDTLATQAVKVPLTRNSRLSVTMRSGVITVVMNNQEILTVSLGRIPQAGTAGVQFPKDAVLTHIEVKPS